MTSDIDRIKRVFQNAQDVDLIPDGSVAPPDARTGNGIHGEDGPEENTEFGIARSFEREHGQYARYDHDAGCWYFWNSKCWKRDTTNKASIISLTLRSR